MLAAMAQRLSRPEYHQWAADQPKGRYERVAGKPVAMAPERWVHVRLKARIWRALDREIRQANLPCQAAPDGMTVEIDDDTDYEPDALVNCGDPIPDEAIAAPNPVVVVEVLSPRTATLTERLQACGLLPLGLGTALPAGPPAAARDHPSPPHRRQDRYTRRLRRSGRTGSSRHQTEPGRDLRGLTLNAEAELRRLLDIMASLRDPASGCPWDKEQTFATIAPYTIEEAYEVADAIARGDVASLPDELGDLLFQVVYHARMAGKPAGSLAQVAGRSPTR
jgi:NTP pyrophosphatase (non-canonical NTP hydrolase)